MDSTRSINDIVPVPIELVMAVEEFVARVERGEIRSTHTYNKFKECLAMTYELQEK